VVWRRKSGGPGGLYIIDSRQQAVSQCWTRLITKDHDRDCSSIQPWDATCILSKDIIFGVHESQSKCQTCPRSAHSSKPSHSIHIKRE
jgi:hypothetical protein